MPNSLYEIARARIIREGIVHTTDEQDLMRQLYDLNSDADTRALHCVHYLA